MWPKAVIWQCLASAIPMLNTRWWNFNLVATRQFGGYFLFRFMNDTQLSYIWQFTWRAASVYILLSRTKSKTTTSDNYNKFIFNVPNRSVCKNFVLFGNGTLLYMERGIEKVSTPEKRRSRCWLHWCLFYWYPWTHIYSSFTPGWMLLSSFAFGEH